MKECWIVLGTPRQLKIAMQKQYWIGECYIDLSRNQIKRLEQVETLQPKVLAVLTILAKHAGQVVSHEQIMDEVWADSVVNPNTLQRCITQLRKALGDNSKSQQIIKTHSKQGYSLEVSVEWSQKAIPTKSLSKDIQWQFPAFAIIVLFIFLTITFYPQRQLAFSKLTPLTATDAKEFHANYSPDGRYLVFHRYQGLCRNHIWAKDLNNNQEIQLTSSAGIYGPHSWSSDGNQMTFTLQENCRQTPQETQKICWRLQSLDFAAALQSPQSPLERLDCDTNWIGKPQWLADGNIVLLKEENEHTKLMKYDVRSDELKEFYRSAIGEIYSLDYSLKREMIAIVSLTQEGKHLLELIDMKGFAVKSAYIEKKPELSHYQTFRAVFHPQQDNLLVNTTIGLYQLSFDGELTIIDTPHSKKLYTPFYHPSGEKLVATHGQLDTDIALVSLSGEEKAQPLVRFNEVYQPYQSLDRSTAFDGNGKFQPNGEIIAFISERTGTQQIWLLEDGKGRQLSQFAKGANVGAFDWSPSGNKIAVIVNDQLTLIDMDGQTEIINTNNVPIKNLVQWITPQQLALVAYQTKNNQILIFDLTKRSFIDTGVAEKKWSYFTEQGEIIFVNEEQQMWIHKNNQSQRLVITPFQLNSKSYVYRQRKVYGINQIDQLWQYDIDSQKIEILKTVNEQVWWLSDINSSSAIVTQGISARKEIVEISR